MKLRTTLQKTHTIQHGVSWEKKGHVMLNPDHVVSQEPFTWTDDKGQAVSGLKIKTVLGDVFHVVGGSFV